MPLKIWNRKDFHIEVLSPASRIIEGNFKRNVDLLKKFLPNLNVSSRVYSKGYLGYLAGTREERSEVFIEALKNILEKGSGGIVFSRGGYGSAHLLPYIQKFIETLSSDEKENLKNVFLFGYSDVTALMWYLSSFGVKSFYTQNLSSNEFNITLNLLKKMAFDNKIYLNDFEYKVKNLSNETEAVLSLKDAGTYILEDYSGKLLGGTLSVIASISGSEFFNLDQERFMFFLEDVDEPAYKIDRYLTQLELSGLLRKVDAIILGSFDACPEHIKVFKEFSERLNIQVYELKDRIGHGGFDRWLYLG